jgi:hypothetical protein
MPEGEDQERALAESPAFNLEIWEFIAGVRAGRAEAGADHLFAIARFLVGLWESTMAGLHQRVTGSSDAEANAYIAELVSAQQALYGSLAAGE